MNSSRLASSIMLRTAKTTIRTSARQFRAFQAVRNGAKPLSGNISFNQRFYSQDSKPQEIQPSKPSKIYSFEDIQTHITSPTPKFILIDVREPSELSSTGTIPGSINIPITTKPDSFFISASEFEDRFGFERPGKEEEVVFFCKAGVRSRAAAELAKRGGWERVGEFPGAWTEWDGRGGEKEKV